MSTGGGGLQAGVFTHSVIGARARLLFLERFLNIFLLLLLNVYCVFIHLFMCVCAIVYLCVYARVRVLAGLLISKCNALV